MLDVILVSFGGAVGTGFRYWISTLVTDKWTHIFPLETLLINITGSFILGFFAGFSLPEGHWAAHPQFRQFFMVGLCGGYTTFSSFSLQTLRLMQNGSWWWAFLNVITSVLLCLIGVWLGHLLAVALSKR